jgi:hypothetical protein
VAVAELDRVADRGGDAGAVAVCEGIDVIGRLINCVLAQHQFLSIRTCA